MEPASPERSQASRTLGESVQALTCRWEAASVLMELRERSFDRNLHEELCRSIPCLHKIGGLLRQSEEHSQHCYHTNEQYQALHFCRMLDNEPRAGARK